MTSSFKLLGSMSGSEYPLDCGVDICPEFAIHTFSFDVESGGLRRTVIRSLTNSVSDSKDADGFWTLSGTWHVIGDRQVDKVMFMLIVSQSNIQLLMDNVHIVRQ